jgi:hypothetical protein
MINFMSEVKDILFALGRNRQDSEVGTTHLGKILMYLEQKKTAPLRNTINILGIMIGAHPRYIREGYMNGIEDIGIVKTITIKNIEYFEWVGLKALTGIDYKEESVIDYVKRRKEEKEVEKE